MSRTLGLNEVELGTLHTFGYLSEADIDYLLRARGRFNVTGPVVSVAGNTAQDALTWLRWIDAEQRITGPGPSAVATNLAFKIIQAVERADYTLHDIGKRYVEHYVTVDTTPTFIIVPEDLSEPELKAVNDETDIAITHPNVEYDNTAAVH